MEPVLAVEATGIGSLLIALLIADEAFMERVYLRWVNLDNQESISAKSRHFRYFEANNIADIAAENHMLIVFNVKGIHSDRI